MKQIQYILLIITLLSSINTYSCINEHRTLLTGEVILTEPRRGKIWTQEIDTQKLREKSNALFLAYKNSNSLEDYSDYGATLIYLGDLTRAKEVYEEIELIKPNLYATASNLGTIYELIGELNQALIWINKSIELNPNSHKGSEWIHIKILEFKLSNTLDYSKSILELNFGSSEYPNNKRKYDLNQLEKQVFHQLKERSNFVKPTNKIVGNIYFDLGNILAQTTDVQSALESYQAAKEYGFESDLMNQRISLFEKLSKKAENKKKFNDFLKENIEAIFWTGIICLILFIFLINIFIKKLKKKKS